jgi:hypothetical protein
VGALLLTREAPLYPQVSVLVSNNINTLFRAADLDALVNFQAKRYVLMQP